MHIEILVGAIAVVTLAVASGFGLGCRNRMPVPPKTVPVAYDMAKLDRDIQRFELALEQMDPRKSALRDERDAHLRYLKAMRDAQGTK